MKNINTKEIILNILKRKRLYNEKENVLIRILYTNGFNDSIRLF